MVLSPYRYGSANYLGHVLRSYYSYSLGVMGSMPIPCTAEDSNNYVEFKIQMRLKLASHIGLCDV